MSQVLLRCYDFPLNPTFALAPQDGHLMPKGDELKFQAGTAAKAE
jgi:hypothetical protein